MNFVQQFGETMRSIDLGAAIGASGFKTIDLVILVIYLVVLVGLVSSWAAQRKVRKRVQTITSSQVTH